MKINYLISLLLLLASGLLSHVAASDITQNDYYRSAWHPIHFYPAIQDASNEQCLSCHQEIIDRKILPVSIAGVSSESALSWYQTLSTYTGPQETFHRRHLVTPLAKELMNMKCTSCHQGWNPREAAQIPPDINNTRFTLRKQVNTEICLMCHGENPYQIMGLPSPWPESREMFQDNCLLCHAAIRTNRHQVNYLNADAIEEAGKKDSDTCFGCHGGRQWYRIAYPYPRHSWDGMAKEVPDWAKDRPTQSEPRFRVKQQQAQK